MSRIRHFLSGSFERKLVLFSLTSIVITAALIFGYLIYSFQAITDFALDQNTAGTEQLVNEFLEQYAQEKATSTWLQINAAQENLTVLGLTAQKIIDNSANLRADPSLLNLALFETELNSERGALTSSPEAEFDALIPPSLAADPAARELLEASALLNLSMDAIYKANPNNAFIYFVGGREAPVTRAYPNIHLVDVLGDGLNLLFWQDYFPENVAGWEQWYRDGALRERIPSPITVEKPYADAAGQGLVVTMFYPLWDYERDAFAGVVGADITLDNIVQNVLSFQVAESGFAFLMNGDGEVVAMPEVGYQLFNVNLTPLNQGGLTYYQGLLDSSSDSAVRELAGQIFASERGLLKVDLTAPSGEQRRELIAFASLPALNTSSYAADQWRIVIAVPEDEVFATLNQTYATVNEERGRMALIAAVIAAALLVIAAALTVRFARTATADLRTLAGAAEQVSARNYALDLRMRSEDEIGQLGRTFSLMAREIRDYTDNLETKVAERTSDLQQANEVILQLNEQLRDENLRLGAELDVARRIQSMVLPPDSEMAAVAALDLAAYMQPADEVGGDYYDVLQFGDRTLLGIGDVTGHGLPAGIIMLMAQTALMTLAESGERDPQRVVAALNRVLYRNIERIREDKNMTLALIEHHAGLITVVGQHESVVVCRGDGTIEAIDTLDLGLPMGLEHEISEFIDQRQLQLAPGDVLLLYTDGVTEAENNAGEFFGIERLYTSLQAHHTQSAAVITERILADLYLFIGDARIHDDISLVVACQR